MYAKTMYMVDSCLRLGTEILSHVTTEVNLTDPESFDGYHDIIRTARIMLKHPQNDYCNVRL